MDVDEDGSLLEHRLVHLDLKGAPPKMSYYKQIFPLIRSWGATGLLVEYEDMFPYSGALRDIAAPNVYNELEIQQFLDLAEENELIVIPLVQTFGHFEFVLKHEAFCHLRELPMYPMTLCPSNEGSLEVVTQMVDQVLRLHPDSKWFHIGADEVFHIGFCEACERHMKAEGITKAQMFFRHIRHVLEYITAKYPGTRLIMWDDMFRDVDLKVMQESGVGELVEPMVWFYQQSTLLPQDMWDRYSQVFSNIWVASAFKGATGPRMIVVDTGYHIENHRSWLQVVQDQKARFSNFRGYTITGWQRYDHFAVLCELLPVALPCLALCLLTLDNGAFTELVHKTASTDLGFADLIPLNPFQSPGVVPACSFPGSVIYVCMQSLLQLNTEYSRFMDSDRIHCWMTPYQVEHNYTNPAHLNHILIEGQQLLCNFQQLHNDLQVALLEAFYPITVDEWLITNFTTKLKELAGIVTTAEKQMVLGGKSNNSATLFNSVETSIP